MVICIRLQTVLPFPRALGPVSLCRQGKWMLSECLLSADAYARGAGPSTSNACALSAISTIMISLTARSSL